ncbi:hypothetical protein GCM10018965_080770 [Nonomuraea roseola]
MGVALAGLRRSTWSLGAFSIGYGLLAVVAAPVAASGGLGTLWVAVLVTNLALVVLQGGGFFLQSARTGTVAAEA